MTVNINDRGAFTRRAMLAMLAAPAFAQLLAVCSSDSTKSRGSGPSHKGDVAKSDLQRVPVPVSDADAAAAAINAFSDDLFRRLVDDQPQSNIVYSAASIALAMSMVSAGAAGPTLREINDVLHLAETEGIFSSMNALSAHLDGIDQSQGSADDKRQVKLNIANSLWGQREMTFEPAFLDTLAQNFGAQMNLVDYKTDAGGAVKKINAWVDDKSEQRIPTLLQPGDVGADTRLVLVNAIYMLATWESLFDKESTSDDTFTTAAGKQATVKMMHKDMYCNYAKGDGWQVVQLPYSFDQLTFNALLPDDADSDVVDAAGAAKALAGADSVKVRLSLPKFDFETRTELSKVLEALGITTAFSGDADFSKITKDEQLFISKVIHQANITVDERGTEAAAATAVVMEVTSAPAPADPIEMTFDRPFQFWISDVTTGAVIFAGRVTDPSAKRG